MAGISTLGQALSNSRLLSDQQLLLNNLTTQLATGKKTQKFSGLGVDALTTQRARTTINTVDSFIENIQTADTRIELMLNTIEEFQAQAENFLTFLTSFAQQGTHQEGEVIYYDDPATPDVDEAIPVGVDSAEPAEDFQTLIEFADNIFDTFVDLLNQKDGDRYLLAGAQSTTKPMINTNTLDAALGAQITDWKNGTITTDDLITNIQERTTDNGNTDAITDTIVGYSAALSSGTTKSVFVRTDTSNEIDYTVLANNTGFRDVLVAVAYFKNDNLPPLADHVDPDTLAVITQGAPGTNIEESRDNFFEVFQEMTKMVTDAIDEIDTVRFKLENVRATIDRTKQFHTSEKALLEDTVSNIEDVDINEVALSINTLAIQLDASYRVTSRIQQLSLVNFL